MNIKTVCNKENGSFSNLWGRKCWVADSMLKLVQSQISLLAENNCEEFEAQNNSDHPFWKLTKSLNAYCEELRTQNGLR